MQNSIKKSMKRDPAIELARLMGCLFVIGCHSALGYTEMGVDESRLLLKILVADGVGIFWLIGGAFLFNNTSYSSLIKRVVIKVLVPMVFVGLVYFYFGPIVKGEIALGEAFKHSFPEYKYFVRCFLAGENGISDYGHTWYLFVYLLLMATYPMYAPFVKGIGESKKQSVIFICISFAFILLNDLVKNDLASFSHHTINGLVPALIITIYGYLIYKNKELFVKRWYAIIAIVVFVLVNLLRERIQLVRVLSDGPAEISIICWFSSLGVICAAVIMIFCISIVDGRKNNTFNRIICFLASYTFPIYLIHILVSLGLNRLGVQDLFLNAIIGRFDNFAGEALYLISVTLCIFAVSFIVSFVFSAIKKQVIVLLALNRRNDSTFMK